MGFSIYDSENSCVCFGLIIDNLNPEGMIIYDIYLEGCDETTTKIIGFKGNYIEKDNRS